MKDSVSCSYSASIGLGRHRIWQNLTFNIASYLMKIAECSQSVANKVAKQI